MAFVRATKSTLLLPNYLLGRVTIVKRKITIIAHGRFPIYHLENGRYNYPLSPVRGVAKSPIYSSTIDCPLAPLIDRFGGYFCLGDLPLFPTVFGSQ